MALIVMRITLGTTLLALLALALRFIPFVLPSYLIYTALIVALAALASVVRPSKMLWMPTRGVAGGVLLVAAGLALAAVLWPLSRTRAPSSGSALDRILPEFDVAERHAVVIAAPPAEVWDALLAMTVADVPAATWLMRVRLAAVGELRTAAPAGALPLIDVILSPGPGFVLLHEDAPRELVVGMAGRPWAKARPVAPADAAAFEAFAAPGAVRIAMNFALAPEGGGGTRLSTETRIAGTDPAGTRVFGRYWRVVYPGSALMRQVWLDAIGRRVG